VIHRGEILADIRLEDVAAASGELLAAVHGGVRALPLAAGVAVEDERSLEDRFQDAGQGMMDDTIPERGGADLALLSLVDRERAIGTGTVGLAGKLLLEPQEFRFEVYFARISVSSRVYKLRSIRSPRTKRWLRGNWLVWLQDQRIRSYVLVITVNSSDFFIDFFK
jgi:hypothetical protein